MAEVKPLRLIAEDASDIKILSAAIQDSVMRAGNLKFNRKARRFTLEINRFNWEDLKTKRGPKTRVRAVLAVDGVLGVKTRAVSKADPDLVMSILSLSFTPDDEPPGGTVSILFAGDGELELKVEAIDMTLLDSAYHWGTRHLPDHNRKRG